MKTNTNIIPVDFNTKEIIENPVEKSTTLFWNKIANVINEKKDKKIVELSTKKFWEKLIENVKISELIKDIKNEREEYELAKKFFKLPAYKIKQIHEEHIEYQTQLAA